jgi:hypothetical protein
VPVIHSSRKPPNGRNRCTNPPHLRSMARDDREPRSRWPDGALRRGRHTGNAADPGHAGVPAQGIWRGKSEIRPFFEAGLRKVGRELNRWHRTGLFFSNGRQLTWEYPRETPQGDQVDLVEVMDVVNGLIAHHRVYWGWVGFQTLVAALNTPASGRREVRQ